MKTLFFYAALALACCALTAAGLDLLAFPPAVFLLHAIGRESGISLIPVTKRKKAPEKQVSESFNTSLA